MTGRDQEVLAEIRRILAEQLDHPEAVGPSDRLGDCGGLDSVGALTLAVGLEDRFRIILSEADAPDLKTFGDLIRLVNLRREESGP